MSRKKKVPSPESSPLTSLSADTDNMDAGTDPSNSAEAQKEAPDWTNRMIDLQRRQIDKLDKLASEIHAASKLMQTLSMSIETLTTAQQNTDANLNRLISVLMSQSASPVKPENHASDAGTAIPRAETSSADVDPALPRNPTANQSAHVPNNAVPEPFIAEDTAETISYRSPIRLNADVIGRFDGSSDHVHFFIARVDSLLDSRPRDHSFSAVMLTQLPLCLEKTAAQWYSALSADSRRSLSQSWEIWKIMLRDAFASDISVARRRAEARVWDPTSEDITCYFYDKVALLRAAYISRDVRDTLFDVWLGLPNSLRLVCRYDPNGDLTGLLRELRMQQEPWKAVHVTIDRLPKPP